MSSSTTGAQSSSAPSVLVPGVVAALTAPAREREAPARVAKAPPT